MEQLSPEDALFIIETYRPEPEKFVIDVLGASPWAKQIEIIQAVFQYKTVAVKTCNAVGKSYIAARIAVTFLTLNPNSIVVTTAPTWRQVTDVLWREIAATVKQATYKLTDAEVRQAGLDYSKSWFAVGLSTKYPENFFGYHANHILVIVDEAGGVPEPIFKGVKAITPNANARVLYIGNPTTPGGTFHQAFDNPRVKTFTISAFDTPNFTFLGIKTVDDLVGIMTPPPGTDPVDHKPFEGVDWPYPALIGPEVVYERYIEWGVDNPAWQSLVMGEFPTQAEQSLIPVDLVLQAMNNSGVYTNPDDATDPNNGKSYAELSGWEIPDGPQRYGLDMARFGSDSTVLTPKRGGRVDKQQVWTKADLVESADRVIAVIDPTETASEINIDDTGNGGGTTDTLRRYKSAGSPKGELYIYTVNAYNFSSKEMMSEDDKLKFHDVTSMLYWNLRKQFFAHEISLPHDKELLSELISRRWYITPAGKIKVESKDEYRKRTGGKSPDKSDSLVLAFAPSNNGTFHMGDSSRRSAVAEAVEATELDQSYEQPITAGIMDEDF